MGLSPINSIVRTGSLLNVVAPMSQPSTKIIQNVPYHNSQPRRSVTHIQQQQQQQVMFVKPHLPPPHQTII